MVANELFYKNYPDDVPQSMSLLDYLNPRRYIDPYNTYSNPFKRTQTQSQPVTQAVNQAVVQASPVSQVASEANKGFNMGNLTDYIPNIFGRTAPTTYEGLLGLGLLTPEQVAQTQRTANIQGLLGAGLALAQGMSKVGPPRTAAENILGALAGGFGAAGGAYQQGLQNFAQQQQLQSAALTQQQALAKRESIERLLKVPEIANDPLKVAYIRSNPDEALKIFSEQIPLQKAIARTVSSTTAPANVVPGMPLEQRLAQSPERATPEDITIGQRGPDALLQADKDRLIQENRAIAGLTSEAAQKRRKENLDQIAAIDKQLDRMSVSSYDFAGLKKSVSDKFKPQVDAIQKLAETGALPAEQIRIAVQEIYKQSQESEKGMRIEGIVGTYALAKYGTLDQSKLTPDQLADVIRFQNAPDADKLAQLQRESQRTQFETGRGSPVPTGRSEFLSNVPSSQQVVSQQTIAQPVTTQTAVTQQKPVGKLDTQLAPTQQAPAVSKVIDPNVYKNPLINRPDSEVPPKKKQELIQAQPGLISATNYTIKNIVDARNAAKSLLDNPAYIDALSGLTAPALTKVPGTDAYTANEILQNILGRSFISEIQEMRSNSPTGGAVGNVAVAEMNSLSKIRGALTVGMNKTELKKQLESYIANADRAMKTIPNDYARTYGYNGEFDDLLASEVVSPKATSEKLPPGVKVRRK